jgi:hypothetical protein
MCVKCYIHMLGTEKGLRLLCIISIRLLKLMLLFRYADFLCRLNDDRNVRALFERALSLLPPEKSTEVTFCFIVILFSIT